MRKFKFLSVILTFMVFIAALAACNPTTSSQEPAPAHTCESVCETCGKCTDADCTETVCADKCGGHEQTPEHTCESVCVTCGKCTDADCTETVCTDKCQGHAHACESVCETCSGCKDLECTEEVCENKCFGHTVADPNWSMYDLSFVSFNVKIPGTAPDGLSWAERSPMVIKFINTSGAHVIGLQECSQTPRGDIQANLAKKYEMIHFGHAENLAIIYDKTVFNLVSQEIYWLTDTPDVKSSGWDAGNFRALVTLLLQHRETGEMLKAMNTHGPLSDAGNVKAFNLISERSLSSDIPMLTFLCGDFNAGVNKLGYVPIAEKLQDCRFAAIESPNRDHNTFHNWGKNTTSIIDFCFVSPSEDVEVLNYTVRNEKWGSIDFLSDHYPIQTTIRVYNPNLSWTKFY